MKKNNTNNASKESTNKKGSGKAPERATLKWRDPAAILGDRFENENKVVFDLVEKQNGLETVTLTIYPSDNDYDNAIISLFGISIRVIVRAGKSGMFISFPSRKGKDGEYFDEVTCYDKNFHSMIKEVLNGYYDDESEGK